MNINKIRLATYAFYGMLVGSGLRGCIDSFKIERYKSELKEERQRVVNLVPYKITQKDVNGDHIDDLVVGAPGTNYFFIGSLNEQYEAFENYKSRLKNEDLTRLEKLEKSFSEIEKSAREYSTNNSESSK